MVNIFSLVELKNTSDDVIPPTLAKLGYKQSHTLMDVRLILGYIGVIAAALAGGYDYKVGFEKAKGYTLIGVVIYFICYGGMNYWQFFVEKGTVYVGTKGQSRISVRTYTSKTSPVYNVEIKLNEGPGHAEKIRQKHELFTKWFDCDGNLVAEPLTTWLGLVIQEAQKKDAKKIR